MEDKGLEEVDKQTSERRSGRVAGGREDLFEHRSLLTKSCSDLVIDLMQVGYIPDIVTCSSPSNRLL